MRHIHPGKRVIEVFTSGDEAGDETINLIKAVVSAEDWIVIEHLLNGDCSNQAAKQYGVTITPSIVIDGGTVCCGQPTIDDLMELEVIDQATARSYSSNARLNAGCE